MLKNQIETREDVSLYRRIFIVSFTIQFVWYFTATSFLGAVDASLVSGVLVLVNTVFVAILLRFSSKPIYLVVILTMFFLITGFGMGYLSILIFAYVVFTTRKRKKIKVVQEIKSITASELFKAYNLETEKTKNKYVDKLVEVSGEISEIGYNISNNLYINLRNGKGEGSIYCEVKRKFENEFLKYQVGDKIIIRGKCKKSLSKDVTLVECF